MAARATGRVMRSTSATAFQVNPLRCVPDMIRLSREKDCNRVFTRLRLTHYERQHFIAQPQNWETIKQFRRRRAAKTRAIVAASGMAGMTTPQVLSGARSRRLQARSGFLLSRLNPPDSA